MSQIDLFKEYSYLMEIFDAIWLKIICIKNSFLKLYLLRIIFRYFEPPAYKQITIFK